jgi:hypothetical protein
MFIKRFVVVIIGFILSLNAKAQIMDAFVHEGEFGIGIGTSQYFGDLTAGMKVTDWKPKFSASVFFRKQFNNYIGVKSSCILCFFRLCR